MGGGGTVLKTISVSLGFDLHLYIYLYIVAIEITLWKRKESDYRLYFTPIQIDSYIYISEMKVKYILRGNIREQDSVTVLII